MIPNYTLYGLNFPELVFFGILIYIVSLILLICLAQCIRYNTFCPASRNFLHCEYISSKCSCEECPNCSLRERARNVFLCNRQHSIYDQSASTFPQCKFKCFKPDCSHVLCFCCEYYIENESGVYSIEERTANHQYTDSNSTDIKIAQR